MRSHVGGALSPGRGVALALAASLAGAHALTAARAAESHRLEYRFEEGAKATYEVKVETDVTTTARKGEQRDRSSTKTDLTLLMDAVEHVKGEGDPTAGAGAAACTLGVTFRDLHVEQEIDGPAGELSLHVEDGDVTLMRGGVTVVDTEEDKGKDVAKLLLGEFAFLGEEGTLTVFADGRVGAVRGPDAFKSFLSADTGAGLFALETRDEAVKPGATWRSEERAVSSLRELDLSANPLRFRLEYTLEEVTERDGRKVAKIAVRSELSERDLSGKVSKEALRRASVTIAKVERATEGVVYFDIERGRVIESDVKVTKLAVESELGVRNRGTRKEEIVATALTGTARVRTKLVATGKVEPPAEKAAEEAGADAAAPAGGGDAAGAGGATDSEVGD